MEDKSHNGITLEQLSSKWRLLQPVEMPPGATHTYHSEAMVVPMVPECCCSQLRLTRTATAQPAGVTQPGCGWLQQHLGTVGVTVTLLPSGMVSAGYLEEGKRGHCIWPVGRSLAPSAGEHDVLFVS